MISKIIVGALLLVGTSAFAAEIPAIPENTEARGVANTASNIFSVQDFDIGEYAYKVVGMDSSLNGDISATTLVLVGKGGVGGAAGYDAAFQMGPTEARNSLVKAEVVKGKLELTFHSLDGVESKATVLYNPSAGTLTEY